jgi:Mg-chelatase subunit ChlD
MSKKNQINLNVYLLLDNSGSMASQWDEALGSVNGYVDELRSSKVVGARVSLVAFDGNQPYNVVRDKVAVSDYEPVTNREVFPRGATPLYDAVGKAIADGIATNAEKTVFVVMTDGYENASKEYNLTSVKGMIEAVTKRGWEVLFLGANFDVSTYTQSFGLDPSKFVNTVDGTRGAIFKGMAANTAMYASGAAAMNFSQADKDFGAGK